MESGIRKCAMFKIKSRKGETTEGTEKHNLERMGTLEEKKKYKYLGILEADMIKRAEKKKENCVSEELENFSKSSSTAEISSKG